MERLRISETQLAQERDKLAHSALADADLAGAVLEDADLRGLRWERVDLGGAKLARANLTGAILIDVVLADADLTDADLRGATLIGVTLTNARLDGSRWQRALLFDVEAPEQLDALDAAPPPRVVGAALPAEVRREVVVALGEALSALELAGYRAAAPVEAVLTRLVKAAPRWCRPRWTLGDYYRRTNDPDAALWAWESALDLDGGDIYAALQASALHLERGNPDGALRILGALRVHGAVARRYDRLVSQHEATALLARGEVDRARQILTRMIESHPDDVEARIKLAEIAFVGQNPSEALAWLRQAHELAPHRMDLPRYMAELLADGLAMPTDAFSLLLATLRPPDPEAEALLVRLAAQLVNSGVASAVGAPPPTAGPAAVAFALERAGAARFVAADSLDERMAVAVPLALGAHAQARAALPSLAELATSPAALAEVAALAFALDGAARAVSVAGDRADQALAPWLEDVAGTDVQVASARPTTLAPLAERAAHWFSRVGVARDWAEDARLALPLELRHVAVGDAGTLDLHVTDAGGRHALVQLALLTEQAQLIGATAALFAQRDVHLATSPIARLAAIATRDDREPAPGHEAELRALLATDAPDVPSLTEPITTLTKLLASGTVPRSGPFLPILHWWGVLSAGISTGATSSRIARATAPHVVLGPLPEVGPLFQLGLASVSPTVCRGPADLMTAAAVLELASRTSFARTTGHLLWPERWTPDLEAAGSAGSLAERRWLVGGVLASRALESVALTRRSEPLLGVSAFAAAETILRRCALGLEALARGEADRLLLPSMEVR